MASGPIFSLKSRGRNLIDMLCSKRMPPQTNANKENPNPNDHNKKEDEPQIKPNQRPECGLDLKNEKGLKIHRTSKHRRKQNATTSAGFWPCNSDKRCETCKKGLFHLTITSSKNGEKHPIKQSLTCNKKNICYLINCKLCNLQYTGETKREFHLRLNSHPNDIKLNQKSTGNVRHFSECGFKKHTTNYVRKSTLLRSVYT